MVLDTLEVQELSKDEAFKIDGGLGFLATVAAGLVVAAFTVAATEVVADWNNFKRGFTGEPERPHGT